MISGAVPFPCHGVADSAVNKNNGVAHADTVPVDVRFRPKAALPAPYRNAERLDVRRWAYPLLSEPGSVIAER